MSEPVQQSESAPEASALSLSHRFLNNVVWNWVAVGANLFVALALSPYIIRKLGAERYGIWALVFSLVDYFSAFDLGLNTAVVNFTARFAAQKDTRKLSELFSTAFFYFTAVAVVVLALTPLLAKYAVGFFQVAPVYRAEFSLLVLLASATWAVGTVFTIFCSALEGFQRFDLTCRAWAVVLLTRSIGSLVLLTLGHGLVAMGWVFVGTQMLWHLWNFLNVRRVCPAARLSMERATLKMWKDMWGYGAHSFLSNLGTMLLIQGPPVVIGHFRSPMYVGFFTLPSRLVQYAVDVVARVGQVTRANTAELSERGRTEQVAWVGVFTNRYCFTLFTPLLLFLLVYGRDLIRVWVGPQFAANSAPLLPILVLATAFAMAGQFNSSAILFGVGKHRRYAQSVLIESALMIVGLIVIIPRYGILGAAWVSSMLMVINRGLVAPWLVCSSLRFPYLRYMRMIYTRPVLTALPVLLAEWWLKQHWLAGGRWPELALGLAFSGLAYLPLAVFTCAGREHRAALWLWLGGHARRFQSKP